MTQGLIHRATGRHHHRAGKQAISPMSGGLTTPPCCHLVLATGQDAACWRGLARKPFCSAHRARLVVTAAIREQQALAAQDRRSLLLGSAALLAVSSVTPAVWSEELETAAAPAVSRPNSYKDEADQFAVTIPCDWVQAEGTATGGRRTVAWFPASANAKDVNITVVITNVSPEFTKLGSFGTAGTFAQNLVNSLDRSYLLKGPAWNRRTDEPIQIAKLVDYKEARGQYFVEYTVKKADEPQRHLLSTLALGSNGRYNRLYTLTAQCREEELSTYKAVLQAAVDSFVADVKPLIA